MSDSLKAALWTALWTFIGLFVFSLLGFVGDISKWADGSLNHFPDVAPLAKAAVSALAAAFAGLLNFIFRFAQTKNVLPGQPPKYVAPAPNVGP